MSTVGSIGERVSHFFKACVEFVGNLGNRTVKAIKDLPATMQQSKYAAAGVFAAANLVVMAVAHKICQIAEQNFDGKLDTVQKSLKYVLPNALFGAAVSGANYLVSVKTNYLVDKRIILAAGVLAGGARAAYIYLSQEQPEAPNAPVAPANEEAPKKHTVNRDVDALKKA